MIACNCAYSCARISLVPPTYLFLCVAIIRTPDCPCHFEGDFCYLQLKIKDTWNQDLPSYFKRAFEFIDGCRASSGMVLVHCTAGVSRSAALTIAYIMQDQTMRLADAYALVKAKRPIISVSITLPLHSPWP